MSQCLSRCAKKKNSFHRLLHTQTQVRLPDTAWVKTFFKRISRSTHHSEQYLKRADSAGVPLKGEMILTQIALCFSAWASQTFRVIWLHGSFWVHGTNLRRLASWKTYIIQVKCVWIGWCQMAQFWTFPYRVILKPSFHWCLPQTIEIWEVPLPQTQYNSYY